MGLLGLWEAGSYRRIGEIPTHGIGPHDVKRLPMSDDLLVANGGIQTDPQDRTMLNLPEMRPGLARITPTGELISLAGPPEDLHQNSTRHLALLPDGRAACAMQWMGDPAEMPPLLALWDDGRLSLCEVPLEQAFAMDNYAGSIAWSPATREIAMTSPRGGTVQVYDAEGQFSATWRRPDACGVAAGPGGFIVTDGNGAVSALTPQGLRAEASYNVQWDNHLIALTPDGVVV